MPMEFRDHFVRLGVDSHSNVTLAQIARGFGEHVGTLDK